MDAALVLRAQQGDEGAFGDLSLAVGPRLLGIAFGILRDRATAEDATQLALVDLWRTLPRLREPSRFEAFAYRLVVHACYAEARRRSRWSRTDALEPLSEDGSRGVVDEVIDRDQLERGFGRLPFDQRAVVVLHHYLGLTLEEVAEALGISTGTVRSRLYRGVQAMRAALDADDRSPRPATMPREVIR